MYTGRFRSNRGRYARYLAQAPSHNALLEELESRVLLSLMSIWGDRLSSSGERAQHTLASSPYAHTNIVASTLPLADTSSLGWGISPTQMRSIYGLDQVMFGSVVGNGAGQTIAIIDAYHYPTALYDLQQFDAAMDLPDLQPWSSTGNTGPWLRVVSQTGGTNYPVTDPAGAGNGTWESEEALDIQWAHAIAPGANIILVEAADNNDSNLWAAVDWARAATGVSVVSMSFSSTEYIGEKNDDYHFTTPAGHIGVTFFASTGDNGQPSGQPAYSPNVVAVGGTSLYPSGSTYSSEVGWSGSGGGLSNYESLPTYQSGVVTQSTTKRANPDVAMEADPNTGVPVYDSWDSPSNPWGLFGGTSLATPMWAGIMAIINQGRVLNGLGTLDGPSQTLPMLYALPATDFHDITSGNNGFAAGTGYDLVTGRGSPVANLLIPDMVASVPVVYSATMDSNPGWTFSANSQWAWGTPAGLGSHNRDPSGGNTSTNVIGYNLNGDYATSVGPYYATTPAIDCSAYQGLTLSFWRWLGVRSSAVAAVQASPDGGATWVSLWTSTGTTVSDSAWTLQTFKLPASFDGKSAVMFRWQMGATGVNSTYPGWNIDDVTVYGTPSPSISGQVFLDANGNSILNLGETPLAGTTVFIDLNNNGIPDGSDPVTTTNASGNYQFTVTAGTYTVCQVLPTGYAPVSGISRTLTVNSAVTGLNFPNFPTVFTTSAASTSYYVTASSGLVQISLGNAPLPTPTYQIAASLLPALTFNFNGLNQTLFTDFSHGALGVTVTVNSSYGNNDQLMIIGAGTTQSFTMTDYLIGLSAGGTKVYFNTLDRLDLFTSAVHYSGQFATLNTIFAHNGSRFYWGS